MNLPTVPPIHSFRAPGLGQVRRLPALLARIVLLAGLGSTAWGQTQTALDVLARQNARQQIQALMADKDNRTKAQQKLDSQLIYAARESASGVILARAPKLRHGLKQEIDGRTRVNLRGTVSLGLVAAIQAAGGTVLNSYPADHLIVALLPLANIEPLAARPDVLFIGPTPKASYNTGSIDSQGDTTHRTIQARTNAGATGAGIKVGVLSDSLDNGSNALAAAYASGDLSSTNTFVLTIQGTNQSGVGQGEGLAMCEIVHDLAPQASLYFATGDPTESQMATNILTMAQFGCRVIIDDLTYNDESPFEDGPIAQAVNEVSAQGVVYFSSARNSGNEDSATSCTWEGDFADGGAWGGLWNGTNRSGRVLAFAPGVIENAIIPGGLGSHRADLFWSDPLGRATNDYDLYMLDANGNVVYASNTTQNGTQDPYEHIEDPANYGPGYFMVVTLHSGTGRFIHLDCGRGHLSTSTGGCTRGHNASGAANAFCVAATPAAGAFFLTNSPVGPFPNSFGSTNRVEVFSADGPRRMFFSPDGSAITPGNFSSTGGEVLQKPDLTAADGVSTTMPANSGLNPFFGTSAAAPHAGAIAALLFSYRPDLTPAQIRAALVDSAILIGTPGWDPDSGAGIIMADRALAYLNPAVAITVPTAGGELSDAAPALILGTATDNTAALGAVRVALTRSPDNVWYNFTSGGWGTTNFDFNNDILGASGTADWSAQLPALPDGNYDVQAQSIDVFSHASPWQSEAFSIGPPPVVTVSALTNGQSLAAFAGLAGNFQDFSPAPAVSFSIYELDINGGSGRWWNGTGFQSSPATLTASVSGTNWAVAPGALPQLNSGQSYQLTVTAANPIGSASTNITVQAPITVLGWDPGQTALGTVVLPNPNTNGGNYWFQISPQTPAVGVWRTALNVLAGQAGVYLGQGSPPTVNSYSYASANPGSNGFVLDASQYLPGQTWYLLVNASGTARWNLVAGDAFVYNLGSLAADNSSSTNVSIGAEGMIFFGTIIPTNTLAWQLWLNGLTNTVYVKKSSAPDPQSYDLIQSGQMLVVPPYLAGGTFNSTYFVSTSGNPGAPINLDSRQQPVIRLAFGGFTNVTVATTNFPYVTFQVEVPVQQIAWQLNLTPSNGVANLATRLAAVPNEFNNEAYSDVGGGAGNSLTLVPSPPLSGGGPGLSAGTYYVTVYGSGVYQCGFTNGSPIITSVSYVFNVTNDAPNRVGWRFYAVSDINSQIGSLGWLLQLSNAPAGSEIAIRRNAVPGQWNYRATDDSFSFGTVGYVDLSSYLDVLQQPGHQADIWYIGVYSPGQALGSFVLTGQPLDSRPMTFDGAGNSVSETNQAAGVWQYYQVVVPADTNLLGWDLRLTGVTAGSPQMYVSRDTLWPNGPFAGGGADWSGCGGPMLETVIGNPLLPGTYYVGVYDPNNVSRYTLESRGIAAAGYSIPVKQLNLTGSVTNLALTVGEADYYEVVVASNTPDWKLHLGLAAGDALLIVQKDWLPNSLHGYAGTQMEKLGDEQWALLPTDGGSNVTAGTYYVLVASQGQNLVNNCEGTGDASYTLNSWIDGVTNLVGAITYASDAIYTNNDQAGGTVEFYQFAVLTNVASIEVTLENTVGSPVMTLSTGTLLVSPYYYGGYDTYGSSGGTSLQWGSGNLLTIPNPALGLFSLSVYGSDLNAGTDPDPAASYVIRIHAVPPDPLSFDGFGNSLSETNQGPGVWHYFQVVVPADTNLLGWDLRLTDVTAGNPQMYISRDTLPPAGGVNYSSTAWPSGAGTAGGADWSGCGGPMLALGVGNPLQAGTYYIGVQDPTYTNSYTLVSRGIGLTGYTIPVQPLNLRGSVTNLALSVGEADYYQVVVASNTPDWKLHLGLAAGDALLMVQKDYLPNNVTGGGYGSVYANGGQKMEKPGDEQWALLPTDGGSNVTAGTYYVLVASQGQNLVNNCEGTGDAGYTLNSWIDGVANLVGTIASGSDASYTNRQPGGTVEFYQFTVLTNTAGIQVTLENTVGTPVMTFTPGTLLVAPQYGGGYDAYGNYGGTGLQWLSGNLVTIPNPAPGIYSLSVYAADNGTGTFPDASYQVDVSVPALPQLSFSPELNSATLTNVISGTLGDTASTYFQVTVPANVNGAAILGWNLYLSQSSGSPSVRVRQNLLPDNTGDTTAFASGSIIIAPPYLAPGTWYVEVKATGSTTFTLTTSVITTNTLTRTPWAMPAIGQTNAAPGLALPEFGDTGVNPGGTNLTGDQGVDLAQGQYAFYAILVPTNNAGLLRTELQAISGSPNLYIRAGAAPTFNHGATGSGGTLIDRQLTGSGTEYGSWVLLNGQTSTGLSPGLWVLSVYASGSSNVRFRLQFSCASSATNGLVQNLPLNGSVTYTNQHLAGGDWRYYRVQIPTNAPNNWVVNWTRSQGNAHLFVRDTVPPGDGSSSYDNYNSYPSYAVTWASDNKNQGPYPDFASPGGETLTTPPLRPGAIYYLGFWSPDDATFSVGSTTNGGAINVTNAIAFYGGSLAQEIPGNGSLRYRMEVPSNATRILFNASNSANLVFTLEQGTVALAGGPAHWTGDQADVSFNQFLGAPSIWPWLPGYSYYLTITNTSPVAEHFGFNMGVPSDLAPIALMVPASVVAATPNPTIQAIWGVTNQGAAPAGGGWYDTVWFSTNGVLDINSRALGNFWVDQTVPPQGGYWQTNSVTLPMSGTGNYTLFVQVDANNAVYEVNLGDKVSAGAPGTFILTPPQLDITSINLSGANLVVNGANGVSGATCYVLMGTNLAQPVSQWTRVATNLLPASGNFAITATNVVDPQAPQRLYMLQLP